MKITIPRIAHTITYCFILIFTLQIHSMNEQKPTAVHNLELSEGEQTYRKKRLPIVKAALEAMLNRKLTDEQVLTIAVACSGGGYRAALYTAGALSGADDKELNLFNALTYISGLSGGTWTIAPLISTEKSPKEFKKYLQECVEKDPCEDLTLKEIALMTQAFYKKYNNEQPMTLVDPYGALLANRLLKDLKKKRHTATLSQQAEKIKDGKYPYPIYTAMDAREDENLLYKDRTIHVFTPDTISDLTNNIHIPTSTYGYQFDQGIIIKETSEETLAYCMGIWGSAFGANLHDIIRKVVKNNIALECIYTILPNSIESERPGDFFGKIPNYMHNMKTTETSLANEKNIESVDAGLQCNLPFQPFMQPARLPDIIFLLDASAGQTGNELRKVVKLAKKHNYPFPPVNFEDIDKKTCSIFEDKNNKNIPTIIYMPRISDPQLWEKLKNNPKFSHYNLDGFNLDHETNNGFCATKNFEYLPKDSQLVMDQAEFNILANAEKIKKAINRRIDNK